MEAIVFNAKKVRGIIKAYVHCPYCDKINSHGSDKPCVGWRGCDKCGRDYRVSF